MDKSSTVLGRIHSFGFEAKAKKSGESGGRKIRGLANANTLDRSKEIVDPKAFKSSLDTYMSNPIVFYNHDWNDAIGKVVSSKISKKGLEVEIEIGKGYPAADNAWAQIEQGILKAFSIGFRPLRVEYDEDNDILTIKDMELFEVSVVTIPMNRESLFETTDKGVHMKVRGQDNFCSYKSAVKAMSTQTHSEITPTPADSPDESDAPAEETSSIVAAEVEKDPVTLVTQDVETGSFDDVAVETVTLSDIEEDTVDLCADTLANELIETALSKSLEVIDTYHKVLAERDAKIAVLEEEKVTLKDEFESFKEQLKRDKLRKDVSSVLASIDFKSLIGQSPSK